MNLTQMTLVSTTVGKNPLKEKTEELRDQIWQHLLDHRKSKRIPENVWFYFIDYSKAFDCVDHNKLWKILKEMTNLPASWDRKSSCMQVKKKQLEPDMEQLVPNWERSTSRLYIVTLLI